MKNILCFGDSLTWGFNAETMTRFPFGERWTGILQEKLGKDYRILEEGLNGRTTVYDDKFTPFKNYGAGINILPMVLDSHQPLDLVLLMLGTNDLQAHRGAHVRDVARGAGLCLNEILKSMAGPAGAPPKMLLLSPPALQKPSAYMEVPFSDVIPDPAQLAYYFEMTAKVYGATFFDTAKYVKATAFDGIHLDKQGNAILANKLFEKIEEML